MKVGRRGFREEGTGGSPIAPQIIDWALYLGCDP
jgi:hypothetical protein